MTVFLYTVCEICGVASEDVMMYGGMHKGCIRRVYGTRFQRTYQRVIDGWWWLMWKVFDNDKV